MKHKTQPLLLLKLFLLVTTLTQISRWMASENDTEDTASDAAFFMLCNVALSGMARLLCTPSPVSAAGTESWVTVMGKEGATKNVGMSIQRPFDENYLMMGSALGTEDYDVLIGKVSAYGDPVWVYTFGNKSDDRGTTLQCVSNTTCFLIGITNSFEQGYDFLIAEMEINEQSLSLSWAATVGDANDNYGFSSTETSNKNLLLTGGTYNGETSNYDMWVINISPSRTLFWAKQVSYNYGKSIQEISSDRLLLASTTVASGAGGQDFQFTEFDEDGNLLSAKAFGGTGNDDCLFMTSISNGNQIAIGSTTSFGAGEFDFLLLELNGTSLSWAMTLGGLGNDPSTSSVAQTIQETFDKDFIFVGSTESCELGGSSSAILIAKFSRKNLAWARALGSANGAEIDGYFSVEEEPEGGYTFIGTENNENILVIKLTEDGELLNQDLPSYLEFVDCTDLIQLVNQTQSLTETSIASLTAETISPTFNNVTDFLTVSKANVTVSWTSSAANATVSAQFVDVCSLYNITLKEDFSYFIPLQAPLQFTAYQTTPAGNQSLPSWLTFNSTSVRFVGTPRYANETGTSNITVVLTDYYGKTSLDFTLTVQGVAPSDGENPISAQFAKIGVPFSLNSTDYEPFIVIDDCPNTVSYSVVEANSNQLPTWLNLHSLSRGFRLTGTPYAEHEGITTIAYTIVDNYGNLTRYFNITTNATLFMVDDNRGSYTLNWPSKPFENITLASDAARATLNATFVITPENAGSVSVTEPDPVTTDGNLEMINAAFSSLCLQPSDNFSNNITIAVYVTDDFHQSATRNFTLLGINAAQGPWCGPPKARSVLPSRTMDVCTDKIFNVSLTEAFYYTAGQSDDALHMSTQVDYSSSSTGWVRTVTTNSVWQLYATPNQPGHTGTTQITLVLNDAYGEATNDFDLTVSGVAPKTIQSVDDTAVNIGDVTLYPDNTPFEEISSSTCTSNPVYTTTQINGNPLPAWITGSINSYQLQINPCDIVGKEKISVLTNLTNNYGWASVNYSIEATGSLDTNVGESVNSCEFTTESQCALYQGNFDIRTPYLIKTESDGAISVQIVVEIDNPEQFDGCTLTTPSGDTSSGQSIVSTYDNKTYTWSVSGAYQNDDNNIMNTILYDIYIECSSPPSHTWNPLVFNFSAIDSCSQRSNVTTSVYYYKSTPSPSPAPVATSSTAFTLDSSAQGGVSMVGGVLFTALLSCICLYTRKRHLLTSRREVEMLRQALIDFITAHNPQGTRQQPLEELFEKLKESTLAYARRNSAQMGIDTKQGGINSEWQQDDTANLENQRIRGLSNAFQQTFDKTSVEALYNSEETFFKIALLYLFENPGASLLKLNLLQLYTTLFEKMDNHAALGASKRIHYLHILTRLTELLILSLNDITLDRKYEIYYSLQRFTTNISRTENDHSKINFYCSLKLTQDLILWMRDNTHTATFLPAVQNRPRFIKDPKQLLRFPKRWVLPIIEMHQKLPWAIEKLAACQDLQRVATRCKDWESLYLTINILEQIACKTTDNTIVSAILTRPEGTKQLGLHEIAQFAANRQLSNPGYRWVKQRVKHALLTIAQKQKGSEITNLIGSIEVDINQLSKKLSVRLSEVGIFATPFASNSDDHSGQEMNLIQKKPGDISSL